MKKSEKGFTLVELLAIIAIISILIIIIAPKIMQIFKNAQKETFMSQVRGMVKSSNLEVLDETGITFDCNKYLDDQKYKDCTGTLDDGISISALGDGEYSNLLAVDVTEDPKSGTIIDLSELNEIKIPKQDIINESLIKDNSMNPFYKALSGQEIFNKLIEITGEDPFAGVPEEEKENVQARIDLMKSEIDEMKNNHIIEEGMLTQKKLLSVTYDGETEEVKNNELIFELNFTNKMLGTYKVINSDFKMGIIITESELKQLYNSKDDGPTNYRPSIVQPGYEFTIENPEKVYLIIGTIYGEKYEGLTIEREASKNGLQLIGGSAVDIHINDVKNYVDAGIKNSEEKLTGEKDFYSYTNLREKEGEFVYNYVVNTDKEIKILKRTINVYDDTPASCFAFAYNNSTGEYAITDYYDTEDNSPDAKSCPAKVYIPDKYNGKNITYISSDAFAYKNIISVRLPINLKYIGDHTFAYNNLSYVELPNKLQEMGYEAFAYNNIRYVKYSGKNKFCNESINSQRYNIYSGRYIGGTSGNFLEYCRNKEI